LIDLDWGALLLGLVSWIGSWLYHAYLK